MKSLLFLGCLLAALSFSSCENDLEKVNLLTKKEKLTGGIRHTDDHYLF
jgi:hypothetical protein